MPELPDVETFRRYMDATSLHQRIEHTHVDANLLDDNVTPQLLQRRLKGQEIARTDRRGKYLFGCLSNDSRLVLHFGMTGFLRYFKSRSDAPDHTRLLVEFNNGYFLAYDCRRKLGTISIADDMDEFIRKKDLGPDALDVGRSAFEEALSGHRGAIKSTLMNQSILSGIGNVYSDEILFQARLRPDASVDDLRGNDLDRLFGAMRDVLETAVECQADPGRFPDSYLTPRREPGETCPGCGGSIEDAKISGRTTYFCPSCQKDPGEI